MSGGEAGDAPILTVEGLEKHYPVRGGVLGRTIGHVRAVDGVSFSIRKGETMGLVGESGCGKSTLARTLLRIEDPTAGTVMFEGRNIANASGRDLFQLRRDLQIIFQDPYSSLNPRMTVGEIVREPLLVHRVGTKDEQLRAVRELLELVGLTGDMLERYPHEFSGGQRQRIGIARALALNPELIVADEPVSALDVSVQAQVINLLQDLQKQLNLTYIFIAHDLSVVRHICDRVAVMYVGKLVELARVDDLFNRPLHPYSEALLAAAPAPDPSKRHAYQRLQGEIADPSKPPPGCLFHPRCPYAEERCRTEEPALREMEPGRFVRCHFAEQLDRDRRAQQSTTVKGTR